MSGSKSKTTGSNGNQNGGGEYGYRFEVLGRGGRGVAGCGRNRHDRKRPEVRFLRLTAG